MLDLEVTIKTIEGSSFTDPAEHTLATNISWSDLKRYAREMKAEVEKLEDSVADNQNWKSLAEASKLIIEFRDIRIAELKAECLEREAVVSKKVDRQQERVRDLTEQRDNNLLVARGNQTQLEAQIKEDNRTIANFKDRAENLEKRVKELENK